MNCKIVFTDTAKSDLQKIAFYIADLTKDKQKAVLFVKDLQAQTRTLEQFPESGALPRDRVLKSSGYRFLVYKDYLLFYQYRQAEGTAYITAVFNGKLDYMRVMKKYL